MSKDLDLTDKDTQASLLQLIRSLPDTDSRQTALNKLGVAIWLSDDEDAWILRSPSTNTKWRLAAFNVFQYGADRLANHLGYKTDMPDAAEVLQRVVGDGWSDVFGPEDYE